MKTWIKFLKDYDGYKKDQIVQVDEETASSLKNLKIAETTESPETKTVADAIASIAGDIQTTVEKGIATGLEKIAKEINVKIPAIAVDHNEQGRDGFKDFGDFAIAVVRGSRPSNAIVDKRLRFEDVAEGKAPTGLNTRDDVDGGFLIPETYAKGIWEYVLATQQILPLTDQRTTSGNSLAINAFDENSRKDGYRDGGVLAYWLAEADQFVASQPKWRRMRLELHKLGVLCYVTDEELADASVSLTDVLQRKAAKAIDFKINESFLWGTGVGQPLGVMRSNALVTQPLEPNQQVNTILHKNINGMYHKMRPELRAGARWYMHPNMEEILEYITFNDESTAPTNPIYMPPGGLSASPYGTLKGRPVVPLEYMRDLGIKGDILFANFGQYVTLTKPGGGIKAASSIHVRFLFEEQAFRFSFRIDGQSLWPSPLEDYNGTVSRSPYVTLADRNEVSQSSGL